MGTQIEKVFEILNDWRLLPNYQLERRADIFFALYLPEIINQNKQKFGIEITYDNIIPEFPLRKGTIFPKENIDKPNQSVKVDYAVITSSKVIFIELKTDNNSVNQDQIDYLEKAKEAKFTHLIEGVRLIEEKTKQKKKYKHLLEKLDEFDLSTEKEIGIVYILPQEDELLKKKEIPMITFAEVIEAIKGNKDELTRHFIESLKKWQTQI